MSIQAACHTSGSDRPSSVFQHLIGRPLPITALVQRLGVTQQTATKTVADLERRGYVARTPDPSDARARLVVLTARAQNAIEGARRHRAALPDEPAERLGPRRVEAARRLLLDVVGELGGADAVRRRQVRAPR